MKSRKKKTGKAALCYGCDYLLSPLITLLLLLSSSSLLYVDQQRVSCLVVGVVLFSSYPSA